MRISAETKSSFSDKERVVLIFKKFIDRKWHCKFRYTSSKKGLNLSLSGSFICFNCPDECSAFSYAVRRTQFDIKSLEETEIHGNLFEDILNKYLERFL